MTRHEFTPDGKGYHYRNFGNTSLVSRKNESIEGNISHQSTPTEVLGNIVVAFAVSGGYSAAIGHDSMTSITTSANAKSAEWALNGISTTNLAAYGEIRRQQDQR